MYLSEELEIMGYRNAEYIVRSILHGLGFDQRMQNLPSKMLSGGQRERISLAAALF
jgi:ATPase subunit of ABC transporter with duplicated ATPase domains